MSDPTEKINALLQRILEDGDSDGRAGDELWEQISNALHIYAVSICRKRNVQTDIAEDLLQKYQSWAKRVNI